MCRPLFFLILATLCVSEVYSQTDPLIEGVVVSGPVKSEFLLLPTPPSNPPIDSASPAGQGLLRFYGCVTCHNLPIPPFRGRWGPDLDTIGSKTTAAWLDRFLKDPGAVSLDAKMPRVPMSDSTRSRIIRLLQTLTMDLPTPFETGGINGRALYDRGDCRTCHRLDGSGSDRGPALDDVGEKIGKAWLVAYLQDPSKMVANSRMPLFEWKEEEASVLATYLLGKGAAVAPSPQITQIERDHTAGEAAQIGCFQCHRVRSFVRTLDLPQPESASGFVGFHVRKNSRIPMDLPPSQVKAMAEALFFPTEPTVSDEDFLKAFWETPIPLQGPAPAVHDSLSSGLKPSDCASCHIKQHREWQESLHAAAMGPGVFGQLADHTFSSPGFAGSCQECHAPNSEQYGSLPASDDYEVNYQFDLSLREEGITCLACHVRGRARFGPPISERPPASIWAGSGHGGAHETTAHQNPTFCSSCHQFEEGDRRLNGKLIQDTFREWEASPQAQQGQTCQTCHMPGRSHRWAGIHDPATVESAIEVGVDIEETGGDSIVAFVQIKNVGAGHHLPTYVTPKIFVTAHLVASSGETLQETALTRSIGREIQLDSEVSREVYDTRIPAGGTWWWRYAVLRSPRASEIAVRLEVFPDHFYARFFDSYDSSSLSNEASAAIAVARENANSSSYIVHEMAIPIQVSSDK